MARTELKKVLEQASALAGQQITVLRMGQDHP